MKRLDAMYKCRLCGKEYVECSTGGEKGNQQFVMGMRYSCKDCYNQFCARRVMAGEETWPK